MKFVIIHGSYGSPEENWIPWLKNELLAAGQEVLVPCFPVDTWEIVTAKGPAESLVHQSKQAWLRTFQPFVAELLNRKDVCFIGHSLGTLFILHILEMWDLHLDSAIFVTPFYTWLDVSWQIDAANQTFYKEDFNFAAMRRRVPFSTVVYTKNDPYIPLQQMTTFAHAMGSTMIEVPDGAHLNASAGFMTFPLLRDICLARLHH